MRAPHRPQRRLETPWALRRPSPDAPGSPPHAWLFYAAFLLFPLWWIAALWRIPTTRRLDAGAAEKAVTIDDPQIEFDARAWRSRCRIMAVVSLFTYVPFIVLVAVFA
ncbi:hypothetical protein K488DRAFT_82200 [Vararia minispora EC-137]|uniref:Uncharacterized protein n=1 Tax=Vararia minispora EC-137 TaxID=1314806 RepID=A0ACB8QWR5_9AGAM|nr:hypothetical protein K488DRAFT_82200 [Vararia minispora EC-137]